MIKMVYPIHKDANVDIVRDTLNRWNKSNRRNISVADLMSLIRPENEDLGIIYDYGWICPLIFDIIENEWIPGRYVIKVPEPSKLYYTSPLMGFDPVNNPSHYTDGRIYEPRKVIADWGLNFNLGNAVKYISRAGRKGNKVEDLKKAIQYIEFEIEELVGDKKHEL